MYTFIELNTNIIQKGYGQMWAYNIQRLHLSSVQSDI